MSHTAELETEFKDQTELVGALKEYFGEDGVEVHSEPVKLKMWNGAESVVGFGKAGEAEIVVRRKTLERKAGREIATNDLGFRKEENGSYKMLVDDAGFEQKARDKLVQEYTARVSMKQLKKQGWIVKRVEEKGVVRVKAQRYA